MRHFGNVREGIKCLIKQNKKKWKHENNKNQKEPTYAKHGKFSYCNESE